MTDHPVFCDILSRSLHQAGIMIDIELTGEQIMILKRIVDLENSIDNFESEKYWAIEWDQDGEKNIHEETPFWNRERAEKKLAEMPADLNAYLVEKDTRPLKRYNKEDFSPEIVERLYAENYVTGKMIKPTSLGTAVVKLFEHIELRGERLNKDTIGEKLKKALQDAEMQRPIGKCPLCSSDLILKNGSFGQFIGCEGYPNCAITFPVPRKAKIIPLQQKCVACGYPVIQIVEPGKGHRNNCINPDCVGVVCPKCGSEMKLRESDYGSFYGCSGYPDCKHTKKIK